MPIDAPFSGPTCADMEHLTQDPAAFLITRTVRQGEEVHSQEFIACAVCVNTLYMTEDDTVCPADAGLACEWCGSKAVA